ncbi:O-antigen ligase [Nocardioides sp.]|uniref:O-antigen ligase family protein n=1 Tax=Nocardioides sp. TaxID=35761 RepID=UPI002727B4C5|nr:O-antigen ligase family protein [Nocardioides sp.]MDO9456505.1 O-antigen ligase family protein [Nocardioides sp.]
MSAVLDPTSVPSVTGPVTTRLTTWLPWASDVAVVAAMTWWAAWLTFGTGGREPHVLSYGALLVAVAALLVRPWRVLRVRATAIALAPGAGAWVVVLTAPTGWAGADDAASYTYAGALGLVALAWARTPVRRQLLATAVVGAAGLQLAMGWAAWSSVPSPSRLFQGTFYWHNQVGAFLAAGAVLAVALVADGRRPLATLGWCLAPLCVAGTVFTTSRGSMLGIAIGVALVLAAAACRLGTTAAIGSICRTIAVVALSWATSWVLTGPPFFGERFSPLAATTARNGSFEGNGVQRFEDWRRSWEIFRHWPASGAGFNSFDSATTAVTDKRDGVSTAFAHNGYLQAASDGGLVLVLPLVVALLALALLAVRALPASRRAGDLVQPGALAAYVVLLLHSGMDFDWTYPSLLAQAALVGVLAVPSSAVRRRGAPPSRRVVVVAVVALVGLLLLSAVGAWHGGLDLNSSL